MDQKPTRFFFIDRDPPEAEKGFLIKQGNQFLFDLKNMQECGVPKNIWYRNLPDGTTKFKLDTSGPIDNVYIKTSAKKKEVWRETRTERLLIGIEYTDGDIDYIGNGYDYIYDWPNYEGYGVVVYDIVEGKLKKEVALKPWVETGPEYSTHALKAPWQTVYDLVNYDGYPSTVYYADMQGPDQKATRSTDSPIKKEKVTIRPLVEVTYSSGRTQVGFFSKDELVKYEDWFVGYAGSYGTPLYREEIWHRTTWLEVDGNVIAGPFLRIKRVLESSWWVEVDRADNDYLQGWHLHTMKGEEILTCSGVCFDANKYLATYGKSVYDVNYYEWYEVMGYPPLGLGGDPPTITPGGTETKEGYIVASGKETQLMSKEFAALTEVGTSASDFKGRCTRIFHKGKDGDPDFEQDETKYIYLFSYREPWAQEEESGYYIGVPNYQYGFIYEGEMIQTTEGYPSAGIAYPDEGYTDYDWDHNIVPDLPENYYSSILIRAFEMVVETKDLGG